MAWRKNKRVIRSCSLCGYGEQEVGNGKVDKINNKNTMTISELNKQAEENYRIAKQEIMFAVSGLIDTAEVLIVALKSENLKEVKAEEYMDKVQDQEQKWGEPKKDE